MPRSSVVPENSARADSRDWAESASSEAMIAILRLLGTLVLDLFQSRRQLKVENLFLRHQLSIALRRAPRPSAAPWQ
jgi:hypothetical protein